MPGSITPWKYVKDQWTSLPPVPTFKADLTGKTVIVTGANVGLGFETTRHFATMNPGRLIMACRNAQKAERAAQTIRDSTGCTTVEAWSLDLADFASVRAFADRFEKEGGGHLDILIENAGIQTHTFVKTEDGWETSIQVNHLATSLLAILFLPYLAKAPSASPMPRLVIVASDGHYMIKKFPAAKSTKILDRLNEPDYWPKRGMWQRYWTGKLLNVFLTRSLAARFPTPPTGHLTIACVNPGYTRSELGRGITGFVAPFAWVWQHLMARTTEVGSRNVVWAALAGKPGEVHGRYVSTCRVEEESALVLSPEGSEIEQRLWTETVDVLSKVDPRVKPIVDEYLSTF